MPSPANINNKKSEQPNTVTANEISTLIADLNSHHSLVRQQARNELIKIGAPAVEALIQAFETQAGYAHWEAPKILGQIHSPKAARALVKALEDDQFSVRWLAAEGLIATGRDGLVPLLQTLEYHSDSVRLREGAHHVLRDLVSRKSQLESSLKAQIRPVLNALNDIEPAVATPGAAYQVLQELKS